MTNVVHGSTQNGGEEVSIRLVYAPMIMDRLTPPIRASYE